MLCSVRCWQRSPSHRYWRRFYFPNTSTRQRRLSYGRCAKIYSPVLRWSLAHRPVTVIAAIAFLVVFGFLITRLGTEFLPALEEGNLWIRATMPPTISLEAGMPLVNR